MEVKFYGVRGSYPIATPDTAGFGGNSTCVGIKTADGSYVIVDGGSGIRDLGREMLSDGFGRGARAHILITHTHWDHILGFPHFEPFYISNNEFVFHASGANAQEIHAILSRQHDEIYFPLPFDSMRAKLEFQPVAPGDDFDVDGAHVSTCRLNHPGVTTGYRIEDASGVVAVLTDTAPFRKVRLGAGWPEESQDAFADRMFKSLVRLSMNADLVVFDTHFDEEEILGKEHWGHSTPNDAIEIARAANARRLALFHHAPEHDDEQIKEMVGRYRPLAGSIDLFAAREGMAVKMAGAK